MRSLIFQPSLQHPATSVQEDGAHPEAAVCATGGLLRGRHGPGLDRDPRRRRRSSLLYGRHDQASSRISRLISLSRSVRSELPHVCSSPLTAMRTCLQPHPPQPLLQTLLATLSLCLKPPLAFFERHPISPRFTPTSLCIAFCSSSSPTTRHLLLSPPRSTSSLLWSHLRKATPSAANVSSARHIPSTTGLHQ